MKNKVFYNVVINEHLWYAICDYFKYCLHSNSKEFKNIDDITLEDAHQYVQKTLTWLKEIEYPYIYTLNVYDDTPHEWFTLYYMVLAYIYDTKVQINKKLHEMSLDELKDICWKTINWLEDLEKEIRETKDTDL